MACPVVIRIFQIQIIKLWINYSEVLSALGEDAAAKVPRQKANALISDATVESLKR